MLNYLLSVIGYKQVWHVSWTSMKLGGEKSCADAVFTISPRLTGKAIILLREGLAAKTSDAIGEAVMAEQISIISIARIGR